MSIDVTEGAVRVVIAAVLAQHSEGSGRGLDALIAMQQSEAVVRALELAGYEVRKKRH
jgi:hypothetical protein